MRLLMVVVGTFMKMEVFMVKGCHRRTMMRRMMMFRMGSMVWRMVRLKVWFNVGHMVRILMRFKVGLMVGLMVGVMVEFMVVFMVWHMVGMKRFMMVLSQYVRWRPNLPRWLAVVGTGFRFSMDGFWRQRRTIADTVTVTEITMVPLRLQCKTGYGRKMAIWELTRGRQ